MRSRYSRRIYSMKYGTEKSDFIDDEDLRFLESLIGLHQKYMENLNKRLLLDISVLSPKVVNIYQNISNNYALIKTSEKNEDLYHNLDLRYEGEEFHRRNIREQIINYLDNKKHQIFTNHRVEFFINIAINNKFENLRSICQEMTYKISNNNNFQKKNLGKLKLQLDNKTKENISLHRKIIKSHDKDFSPIMDSEDDEEVINDTIFHDFSQMDTLLLPYIKMIHPKSDLDYEISGKAIADFMENTLKDDIINNCENNYFQNSSETNSPNMPTLFDPSAIYNDNNISHSTNNPDLPPLFPCGSIKQDSENVEIIEISDEEHENEENKFTYNDIDQMIDFLIHRCNIQYDLHPSLLKDHQMHVELNGFLLFVNFSVRFSLRYNLNYQDRKIFDCIFISSIVVGLRCLVYMNDNGINIHNLTKEGFKIVTARLKSVQLPIIRQIEDNNLYSVLINPDITRLVHLTLQYIHIYHDTGELIEINGNN